MEDPIRGSGAVCNDRCGCPSPCPGGIACRCSSGSRGEDDPNMQHNKCSCGEHCSCNPCACPKSTGVTGSGKALCQCGDGCACVTCTS